MKLLSKKSAPKKSPFMVIDKKEFTQVKGGKKLQTIKDKNDVD